MKKQKSTLFIQIFILLLCAWPLSSSVPAEPQLNKEQQKEFLSHAEVIHARQSGKGVTRPYCLTLTDGNITHDASFQSVFERENYKKFDDGTTEMNFVDSYFYNIAAYRLAVMLGLGDMVPVTVERKWKGKVGSLSWWLPVQMNEGTRTNKKIRPPDVAAHNRQIHKIRVFTELIYNTDYRNAENILIGENWEVYMIDFSRAFRLYHDLIDARNLVRCSRDLLSKLEQLDQDALAAETKGFLNKEEVKGVMARRDLIVAYFKKLVAEKGEEAVLY
jgi:hypothetical protein